MNRELITQLGTIIGVLETVDVKGQSNLLNLGGSIAALKDIYDKCVVSINSDETEEQPAKTEDVT